MTEVVVGIDIGGTNTAFGIVDHKGKCLIKNEIETRSQQPCNKFFDRLFSSLQEMFKDHEYQIKGIGIGAPNGNYYTGKIENPPNLKWGNVNLVEMVKKYYNVPIVVTNDANAAALGEMKFGAARKMKNFILITLGTGLGSGIVVNGELLYGHDGFAGELGHVIVEKNGRLCGCGRRGCLETYASATGIRRTAFEKLAEYDEDSLLRHISCAELTARTIYEFARKGDRIAIECFNYTGKILGEALADAVAYLSPEAIIIFGGLAKSGDLLLNPVREHYEKNVLNIFKNKVKIMTSQLKSDEAAILGAGALIWHEMNHRK
ncbi:MAG: ROK family protein [Calditrichaceae bacterium]|nr:ROK family protein [Calditrichaceae bacterium]MBN2710355.1 ROK family protein [Calditrichaceae bacterium]RQV95104.1 MAG: ROK family protein [Calditrichota bacterium]